ncbi:membrane anchor subunit of succinate dehydrogenase, Sdh4 [Malassezia arunalokei]|uniref:Succinate dehydrogenase [ubiquinone] cytochrome b small subunit n=1 Tax=Malassezia arunalokei TaxID=1514897 RepID=A0AAJ6CJY6_9BASI|nr:membrane anchor subunit of succinate dehydrogenase, Sdh4 [Malassezia arunalokei]
MSLVSIVGLNKALPFQSALSMATRGFHAAYIKGTVNDPAEYPAPNAAHGSYHWVFERVIAVSLIPLFAAATVKHGACGMVDASLSVALLLHSHMGFEQVLIDYVEKRKFPKTGPIAKWILRAATLTAAVGLYEFNTNDIGITELVARLWTA